MDRLGVLISSIVGAFATVSIFTFDILFSKLVMHYTTPALALIFFCITQISGTIAVIGYFIIIGALGLFVKEMSRLALEHSITIGSVFVVSQILKHIIGRARPEQVLQGITHWGPSFHFDSLPSGHTSMAFALATFWAWKYPHLAGIFFLLAVAIGFSRIILKKHFLSDVLFGALLGLLLVRFLISKQFFFAW